MRIGRDVCNAVLSRLGTICRQGRGDYTLEHAGEGSAPDRGPLVRLYRKGGCVR